MTTLVKWSVKDYHQMITAGILQNHRVELLAGDIVEMSPEGPIHASRIRKVGNYLRNLLNDLALVSEAHPITLAQSEPEPDLAIVRLPEERYNHRHPGVDDILWLIEISDTTLMTDLNQKRQIYATAGIDEYWLVNVPDNCLMVFRQPVDQEYTSTVELSEGTVTPIAFPALSMSVHHFIS